MKKLTVLLLIVMSAFTIHAQTALPKFTVSPAEIDALTENVSIVFDVTGSAVEGLTDVYIWAWAPGLNPSESLLDYDQGTPNWGSISQNAKLEAVAGSPNKFKLSLPKTVTRNGVQVTFNNMAELFGVADAPGKIKEIGFLLRSQDGSKQTPGDLKTKITLLPLEFTPAYFRTFPAKVSNRDVVTAYLNLNLIESGEDQKLIIADKITASVTLLTANNTTILTVDKIVTRYTPEKEYAFTFLPEMVGTLPTGVSLSNVANCRIVFSGVVYDQAGGTTTVSSKPFEFGFQQYE
jgi:hypothetical protein